MVNGISGPLLSISFLGSIVGGEPDADARSVMAAWNLRSKSLGPASSVRAMLELGAAPLLEAFGWRHVSEIAAHNELLAATVSGGTRRVTLVVTRWGERLDRPAREAVGEAIRRGTGWCLLYNGLELRLVCAAGTFGRRHTTFAVDALVDDNQAAIIARYVIGRLGPEGETGVTPLHAVVRESDRHASGVCRSLRHGVLSASEQLLAALVGRRRSRTVGDLDAALDQSLTIVYRILFLLFAEARAAVPVWHQVYRDGYTIAAMQQAVERGHAVGLWDALRAVARLAHAGCTAGDLQVTPFNGRLFAPARTPLADRRGLDDGRAASAIASLTSRPSPRGREPIAYGDLGVEQLGSVYETLLDYRPQETNGRVTLVSGSGTRKSTGTFYTPQTIADHLVRDTLEPLVRDRTPEDILRLRILDPAMGSGAFLVSACRYLGQAYETASIEAGGCDPSDFTDNRRASIRRCVAELCLYGVDLNPMAVQLARLSMWLATLAADRPLTFLDHRLQTGDSLLGAWLSMLSRPPRPLRQRRDTASASLFGDDEIRDTIRFALPIRLSLEATATAHIDDVRAKERACGAIGDRGSLVAIWKQIADLWCAAWLAPPGKVPAEAFASVAEALRGGWSGLPPALVGSILEESAALGRRHRLFHWELEFPEVFFDADGSPLSNGGFDAVIGNPPWEMLRADPLPTGGRDDPAAIRRVVRFTREAGAYRAQSDGHANCYQLFVERAVALCRNGGRIGLALPSGLATDRGSAGLRRLLISHCSVERLTGLDNRRAMFPIHRSVRFLLMTARKGAVTTAMTCRFGLDAASDLHADSDRNAARPPLRLTPALVERLSGSDLTIPWLESPRDLAIAERAAALFPRLGEQDGWHASFGRELNATEDGDVVRVAGGGLAVVEGKHLGPFNVDLAGSRRISAADAAARLPDRRFVHARLAYRDVASATNRLTLIAALLPPDVVSTHTVFCLRVRLSLFAQHVLCGLFNSFVVNFLVRLRVTTHVSTHVIASLPVPTAASIGRRRCLEIASISRMLHRRFDVSRYGRLQALVASIYGLTREDFEHVLGTFPLVEAQIREEALRSFIEETRR